MARDLKARIDAGLDAAIMHAGRIEPLHLIADEERRACLDLIYDRRAPGYDPLEVLLAMSTDASEDSPVDEERSGWPIERRLGQRIIDGNRVAGIGAGIPVEGSNADSPCHHERQQHQDDQLLVKAEMDELVHEEVVGAT